jgi:hypothetical protein
MCRLTRRRFAFVKKTTIIALTVLLALAVLLPLLFTAGNAPRTTWQTLEVRLPAAVQSAGFRTIGELTEGSDRVSLPFGLRVQQLLRPEPRPKLEFGFPDSVLHYTVESIRSKAQLHCLVRYSAGKVARIVVRFPPTARQEAVSLRDALRREFPTDRVSLHESTDG